MPLARGHTPPLPGHCPRTSESCPRSLGLKPDHGGLTRGRGPPSKAKCAGRPHMSHPCPQPLGPRPRSLLLEELCAPRLWARTPSSVTSAEARSLPRWERRRGWGGVSGPGRTQPLAPPRLPRPPRAGTTLPQTLQTLEPRVRPTAAAAVLAVPTLPGGTGTRSPGRARRGEIKGQSTIATTSETRRTEGQAKAGEGRPAPWTPRAPTPAPPGREAQAAAALTARPRRRRPQVPELGGGGRAPARRQPLRAPRQGPCSPQEARESVRGRAAAEAGARPQGQHGRCGPRPGPEPPRGAPAGRAGRREPPRAGNVPCSEGDASASASPEHSTDPAAQGPGRLLY